MLTTRKFKELGPEGLKLSVMVRKAELNGNTIQTKTDRENNFKTEEMLKLSAAIKALADKMYIAIGLKEEVK